MSGADVRRAGAAAAGHAAGRLRADPGLLLRRLAAARWLAVVLVVLAGGLLLRVGGPALWARADAAAGRCPRRLVRAAGSRWCPLGQLFLVLCLLTARYAPAEAVRGRAPDPDEPGASWAAVLADGGRRAARAGDAGPAADRPAGADDGVRRAGRRRSSTWSRSAGRQAALAGLGLLVLYCVPVATITGGIGLARARRTGRRAGAAAVDRPATAARRGQPAGGARTRRAPGTGTLAAAPDRRRRHCSPGWSSAPSSRR